jgi:FHS family Na+ dependent glucose MFS transporter 1
MKNQTKIRRIALYYSVMLYVGMATAVLGPSLLDLIDQTNSTLQRLSMIFPARAASYLVGNFLAGILFDRYHGHRLLALGISVMGLTLVLVPFLSDPIKLILVMMATALAMGLVDVGCNTLLFRLEDIKLGPVMNGLHLFFGMGSFFAPLVLIGSLANSDSIQWGYWGLGLFSLMILLQLINLSDPAGSITSVPDKTGEFPRSAAKYSLLILVISVFFFAYVGVEVGFGDWLSIYSIQAGLAGQTQAIMLTSLYWGSFTIGRLASIPLAVKFRSKQILSFDIAGGVVALGLVFLFPGTPLLLWIGSILLGFSLASIFPTMLTFSESLMPMTGTITSRFFISGSIGSIVLPWIIGRFIEKTGPFIIIQALSIAMILAVSSFALLSSMSKKIPQKDLRE